MNFRKGISPMVATVLLIVFAIALGGIIFSWLTNYSSQTTQETSAASGELADCAKAGITIDAVYKHATANEVVKVDVRNTGQTETTPQTVTVSSATGSCTLTGSAGALAVGGVRTYSIANCAAVTCSSYANTRITTTCGSVSATHTTNTSIIGC